MTIEWDYQGIGYCPDGSAYVIDTDKAHGEPRWWFVRLVPEGESPMRDGRTFTQYYSDKHQRPIGVQVGETSHSELRARQIAEKHYLDSKSSTCSYRGCRRIPAEGNLGRCTDHGKF